MPTSKVEKPRQKSNNEVGAFSRVAFPPKGNEGENSNKNKLKKDAN